MYDYADYGPSTGEIVITIIISVAVAFALWLLIREIVCWYFKINDMKENQEKIISLLSSIDNKLTKPDTENKVGSKKEDRKGPVNVNDLYTKRGSHLNDDCKLEHNQ